MSKKKRINELIKIYQGNEHREAVYQYIKSFLKKENSAEVFSEKPPSIVFYNAIELAGLNADERERYTEYFQAVWAHTIAQYKNPEIFASLCVSQIILFLRDDITHGNYDYRFVDDEKEGFTTVTFRTPIGPIEDRNFLYMIEDSIYNLCALRGIDKYAFLDESDGEGYIYKERAEEILNVIVDLSDLMELGLVEETVTLIFQCLEKRFEYYFKHLKGEGSAVTKKNPV